MTQEKKAKLGKILLKQQLVSQDELSSLLDEQLSDKQRLASKAYRKGMVDETHLLKALSEQHGIPATNMDEVEINLSNLDIIPRDIALKHLILPIAVTKDAVNLAMADPDDRRVVEEIEFVTGKRVFPHVALHDQLLSVIEKCYADHDAGMSVFHGRGFTQTSEIRRLPISGEPRTAGTVIADVGEDDFELNIEVDVPAEEEVVQALSAPPPPPASYPSPPAPTAKKILVVDDEEDILLLFNRVLTDKGYTVITASRGLEAVNKVQSDTPDIIVLDAMLPEVHGFDICKRIKNSSKYGHIPVLMISAIYRGWRYARDLKNSYGVDEFIEKPFKINELLEKVEQLLKAAAPAGPPEASELSLEAERILSQCIDAYRSGRVDEAIELLKKGIGIDPLAYKLHYHLALLLGKKNLNYQAIRSLENALELAPDYFPALKNLAVLYQKTGFKFKAIETWERALSYCAEEKMREKIKTHLMKLL
jgi:DNA-binding response OmpR family regulator